MRLIVLLSVFVISVTCTNTAEEKVETPYDGIQDPRLFATTTTTTTTTVTVASTIPCTSGEFAGLVDQAAVDALTKCPISLGRRRRGVLYEEDDEEQFSINPSAIQGVEATHLVPSARDGRAADPQYLMISPFGYHQIQPGFYGSPFNYRPVGVLPYAYPAVGQQRAFGTTISSVFNALVPSNLKGTFTSTITSTFFTVVTSRSTATCSPPPNALRCD
ncbi:hypothetical protein GHT06_007792 [Daphnia sinensis]|uniref:Secreted protein n=1 Tax=Daphnia sinensis TaxID=1820382 RepID=A0AAD5L2F3_9CRUS|nr:hypothetical protein GHT06_007792 [Daphnia sinensis]